MRGFLGIATAAIVSNLLCSSPSYSNQDYVIPDGLIPMSEWANGTSAKKAEQFRITYRARDFWAGTDNTVFAYLNLSEVLNTMIVSRAGPIAPLEVEANEAVAGVVATTKLGTLSLREAIAGFNHASRCTWRLPAPRTIAEQHHRRDIVRTLVALEVGFAPQFSQSIGCLVVGH